MHVVLTVHKHTDTQSGTPIDPGLVDFSYSRSRNLSASEGLSIGLKMTLLEAWYVVRPGDWLVLWSPLGPALSFGYVVDVSAGVSRSPAGQLGTDTVRVTCISWFELLKRAQIFVPGGDRIQSVGAVFSLDQWVEKITNPLIAELTMGNIGWSLAYTLKTLGRIKLPLSMGGEYLGDAVRVAYDEPTRVAFCPNRVLEEVAKEGLLPQAFTAGAMQSGIGELLSSVFYPDPVLIEMFCSLEAGGAGILKDEAVYLDEGSGNIGTGNVGAIVGNKAKRADFEKSQLHAGDSRLAAFLGRRPVLIYRVPPWRIRALHKSAIARMDFKATNDEDVAQLTLLEVPLMDDSANGGFLTPNKPLTVAEGDARYSALRARSDHEQLLATLYHTKTWDIARATPIPRSTIRSFRIKWSDADRVNVTTIGIPDGTKGTIEAATYAGLPITIDESIERYGPRVARPTWPFMRSSSNLEEVLPNGFQLESFLRSIAAQLMQFQVNAHLMGSGTLVVNYSDTVDMEVGAQLTSIFPGEIIGCDLVEGVPTIFAYVDQVDHQWNRGSDGSSSAVTTITFSRATLGITDDIVRDSEIPMPNVPRKEPAKADLVPATKPTGTVSNSCPKVPGKAQSTEISRSRSILVSGAEKAVSFDVTRHILPTQAADELYDSAKAKTGQGFYTSYRTGSIKNAVVHYNVGGYASNNERLYNHFKKYYTGVAGKFALGSHFGINSDGEIAQFLDCRNYANHVGTPGVNCASIGIDLINPFSSGKAAATAAAAGGVPRWPILSGWKILSPTGGTLSTVNDFFGPTMAQQRSLNKLLHALGTHVGVNVRHDARTTTPRAFQKLAAGDIPAALATGGVWHHAQLEGNRADSLGTNLASIIAGRFDTEGLV